MSELGDKQMQIKNNEKGVIQTIVIPFTLRKKLVKAARENGQSISSIVCKAIEQTIKERAEKTNKLREKETEGNR